MNDDRKPVVAHFDYPVFLAKSETFIYQYISHLKRVHPVCLSWGFENLDQFPVPDEDLCLLSSKKYSLGWLFHGIWRRYLKRDRAAEKIAFAFLENRKARLIHAHFGTTGVLTFRLKKALNIPHVTTFYGFDISQLAAKKKWLKLFKVLFHEGDLFLVEGPHMNLKLKALGCPEDKIRIQRIAIHVDQIFFRPRKPKEKGEKAILIFAGRFIEKKGLIYALQALKKVRIKNNDFEFRIVGDGPLKVELTEFIRKNRMENYIRLLGFLSYEAYLKEMQKADIFLHPSVTAADGDSEGGAPTTILEAQAMGMPVISSYHADIPNIVVPGESALLSEERDREKLSENILHLLDSQAAWKEMGHAGRGFVEKYHNITKEVITIEDKYLHLINQTV
jgi:colanic acid/amylovoran biosynthesis glycosyltransferase